MSLESLYHVIKQLRFVSCVYMYIFLFVFYQFMFFILPFCGVKTILNHGRSFHTVHCVWRNELSTWNHLYGDRVARGFSLLESEECEFIVWECFDLPWCIFFFRPHRARKLRWVNNMHFWNMHRKMKQWSCTRFYEFCWIIFVCLAQ